MQVVYARCCGLDVHQKTVAACVLLTNSERERCAVKCARLAP